MGTRTTYRIVVRAEFSERYAAAFEGMDMEVKNGRTILTGEVIDQPHLHGILDRTNALGLRLVTVEDFVRKLRRRSELHTTAVRLARISR